MIFQKLSAGRVHRSGLALVRNKISQRAILILAHLCVERCYFLADFKYLANTVRWKFKFVPDFLGSWFPPQSLHQALGSPVELINSLHHMNRNANGAGLISNRTGDCLPNPPGSVGTELESPSPIILFNCSD